MHFVMRLYINLSSPPSIKLLPFDCLILLCNITGSSVLWHPILRPNQRIYIRYQLKSNSIPNFRTINYHDMWKVA